MRSARSTDFNPRTPCGVRPIALQMMVLARIFQSTHPLRGATRPTMSCGTSPPFQSTHPLRGATDYTLQAHRLSYISIHAPLAGCDPPVPAAARPACISIHAPLAGCDPIARRSLSARPDFNPRTPCGVRLGGSTDQALQVIISIHAPLAGCDFSSTPSRRAQKRISIHAPLAGCDSKNVQRKLHFFELADKLSARIAAKKPSAKADRCA